VSSDVKKLINFWEKDKSNFSICHNIMALYSANGQVQQAEKFLSSLSAQLSSHSQLVWLLGKAYCTSGDFKRAAVIFSSLPEDEQYSRAYGLTIASFFQHKFQEAEQLISPLVTDKGEELPFEFTLLLAKIFYHQGRVKKAIDLLIPKLESQHAVNSEFLGLLSMLFLDDGQIEKSFELSRACLAQTPLHHDGLLANASCHVHHQNYAQAIDSAMLGVSNYPSSGRFWSVLSQSQLMGLNVEHAYASIKKAAELQPEHIGTWHIKAWIELINHQFQEAEKSFNTALTLNRNFAETHGGLAVVKCHKNNMLAAIKHIKTAKRLDPNSFSAAYAESLIEKQEFGEEKANARIQKLLEGQSHIQSLSFKQLISQFLK
jgi:tetratricopeptide (TPR) repeat protein